MTENNRYREEELDEEVKENEGDKKGKKNYEKEMFKNDVEFDDENVAEVVDNNELETLKAQVESLTDQLLRNRAELENFKRRSNEERAKDRKYALQDILTDLVEIIDLFDSVVNTKTDDEKVKSFLIGFQMLNNKFKETLENYGTVKIDALNKKFDPTMHEAMGEEIRDDLEEETVIRIVSNGYMYKDRVIKPSKVIVSKKSK